MKIIQINAIYGEKSTGRIVKEIDDLLKTEGYETGIVVPQKISTTDNVYAIGNAFDWKWHALYTRLTGKQGFASKSATKRLLLWLDKQHPDVIHLHNIHGNFVNIDLLFSYIRKNNIPTVITMHDCWYFTGKCFHFIESNCDSWKTVCQKCPRKLLDIPNYFRDSTTEVFLKKKEMISRLQNVVIVGCSEWITDLAKHSFLCDKPIVTIYNGVDTNVFAPVKNDFRKNHRIDNDFVILGMANKWNLPENRFIVDAISNIDGNISIVLVGCKKEDVEYFRPFKNIICVGYVNSQSDLAEIYSSADVFVNLTLADNLPTVNMEAQSCGTPVITYDTGGSPELVIAGKTGYVVPQLDEDALLEAIQKIRNGMISRAECREIACQRFDKNKNYMKYIEIYNKYDVDAQGEGECYNQY
jgi:glycosyltransferase involved in cell wall biosynthesis